MRVRFEGLESFRSGLGRGHLVAFALEKRFQNIADDLFVIHDKDAQGLAHDAVGAAGSVTQASTPPPSRDSRPISPPCRRTISREIARPRPVPPDFLVVKNGWNSRC